MQRVQCARWYSYRKSRQTGRDDVYRYFYRNLACHGGDVGAPDFPLIFTPHPIAHLSQEQLRQRAEAMQDEIVATLTGKTVSTASAS